MYQVTIYILSLKFCPFIHIPKWSRLPYRFYRWVYVYLIDMNVYQEYRLIVKYKQANYDS